MESRLYARIRLFAVGAVLAAVMCSASVALAFDIPFTDIPGLPDAKQNDGAHQFWNGDTLMGGGADYHQVYKFYFKAGEGVSLTLSGMPQVGIKVFDEKAETVFGTEPLEDTELAWNPTLTFTAPYNGFYFIECYMAPNGTSTPYILSLATRLNTDLVLEPVKNIVFGGTAKIKGVVTGQSAPYLLKGDVVLYYSFDGVTYHPEQSQEASGGAFEFSVQPNQKWYYKVQYLGSTFYNPSAGMGSVSTPSMLSVVAAKRYATRSYTLSGTLGAHISAKGPVRVYLWRYTGGKWKAAGYRSANSLATYSTNYKFPYTGKWRMRAYHSDAGHLPTWSGYSYLTVK